jgi:DNA-binding XRE family transcriptional regulator
LKNNFKTLYRRRAFTVAKLAKASGLSEQTICNISNPDDTIEPTVSTMQALADALDVSYEDVYDAIYEPPEDVPVEPVLTE